MENLQQRICKSSVPKMTTLVYTRFFLSKMSLQERLFFIYFFEKWIWFYQFYFWVCFFHLPFVSELFLFPQLLQMILSGVCARAPTLLPRCLAKRKTGNQLNFEQPSRKSPNKIWLFEILRNKRTTLVIPTDTKI